MKLLHSLVVAALFGIASSNAFADDANRPRTFSGGSRSAQVVATKKEKVETTDELRARIATPEEQESKEENVQEKRVYRSFSGGSHSAAVVVKKEKSAE